MTGNCRGAGLLVVLSFQAGCAQSIWNERLFNCGDYDLFNVQSTTLNLEFGLTGSSGDGCEILFRKIIGSSFKVDGDTVDVSHAERVEVRGWTSEEGFDLQVSWTEAGAIWVGNEQGGLPLELHNETAGAMYLTDGTSFDVSCDTCVVNFDQSSEAGHYPDLILNWKDNAEVVIGGGEAGAVALRHPNSEFPEQDPSRVILSAPVESGAGWLTYSTTVDATGIHGALSTDCGLGACALTVDSVDLVRDLTANFNGAGYVDVTIREPSGDIWIAGPAQEVPVMVTMMDSFESLVVENAAGDICANVPAGSYEVDVKSSSGSTDTSDQIRDEGGSVVSLTSQTGDVKLATGW